MIFKRVPLKQKGSELHPCKRPPVTWWTAADQFDLKFRNIAQKISWKKSREVQMEGCYKPLVGLW